MMKTMKDYLTTFTQMKLCLLADNCMQAYFFTVALVPCIAFSGVV